MDEKERHAAGMSVRRKVLGDAHVDRSVAKTNDLTRDFQDLITRYAWGEIWTRPGLPRHTHQRLVQTAGRHVDRNDPLFFRRRRARQHHRRRACGQQQSIGPGHIVSPRIGIAAFRCPRSYRRNAATNANPMHDISLHFYVAGFAICPMSASGMKS